MDCGMKFVKWLLFAFNLIFFICGLALIITGAVINFKFKDYVDFFEDKNVSGPAILLIVVGVIIFFIGFFGCWGAAKENRCMVLTFAVMLIIIFVMEIGAGIAAYVYRGQIEDFVEDGMKKSMVNYDKEGHKGVTDTWDTLQRELSCCGVTNSTDWLEHRSSPPDSCCSSSVINATCPYFTDGCLKSVENKLFGSVAAVGGVGIGFAVIQMIGIVFACCLARAMKEYDQVA